MNRDDYVDGKVDHQTFYCALVDAIGRSHIESLVLHVADLPTLREAYKTDKHMNNIPLAKWDRMDPSVRASIRHSHMAILWSARAQPIPKGKICWSLSDSVCVLKAAACRMVLEANERGSKAPEGA